MAKRFKRGDVVLFNGHEAVVVVPQTKTYDGRAEFIKSGGSVFISRGFQYEFTPTKKKPWEFVKASVDGFPFAVFHKGNKNILVAGCRTFRSLNEAKQHWRNDEKGFHFMPYEYAEYDGIIPGRRKANARRLKGMTILYNTINNKDDEE